WKCWGPATGTRQRRRSRPPLERHCALRELHVCHDSRQVGLLGELRVEARGGGVVVGERRTAVVSRPVLLRVTGNDVAGAAQEVTRQPLAERVRDVEEVVVVVDGTGAADRGPVGDDWRISASSRIVYRAVVVA